ncbi:sulfotransferase [Neiella sp. HB171785]|uniref:Sulfotransferase n=1 Tax=Neiella litorisoli TaxID=2771431 RepID=A0A8J6QMF1_9GAMM|nr:sulfotransferase [Neiella litorisoli]MBD1390851.1 sulfotransferase [Neiella litorisoli]
MPQHHLFITGTSRSGTTTIADFLRNDRAIVMGRERFAWRLAKSGGFDPSLFAKHRFCIDYQAEDSHHAVHQAYYGEAVEYFDQAKWVGDKLPSLFNHYDKLIDNFPACQVIYMVRNPYEVADSYQKRADKTQQQVAQGQSAERLWPIERNWRVAIDEWNESIAKTLDAMQQLSIFVIKYEDLYRDTAVLEDLYQTLQLPLPAMQLEQWQQNADKRKQIEAKRVLGLDEQQRSVIAATINLDNYHQLLMR